MAYVPAGTNAGIQPIASVAATPNHPLGFLVQAYDPVLGGGEFIYLQGPPGGIATGSLVTYDTQHATALVPTSGGAGVSTNVAAAVAVAMAPTTSATTTQPANIYGWYQIGGNAAINRDAATAVPPKVALYTSVTSGGFVTPTVGAGRQILSCRTTNTASVTSGGTINAVINRPNLQGQIA